MTLYEELVARGLIAQVTDEDEIKDLINNGKAVFYIGFDPTADSLHVGHFMALCLMKRLQMAGNKPIALIGGGTAMIGDPSGRTDMRQMMTKETIQHNVDCFKKQMERFIDFGEGKAQLVNNADWLLDLNYVELMRDVGAHFSVNRMLAAECYKQRMEKGLSFLEFNYMIMQSCIKRIKEKYNLEIFIEPGEAFALNAGYLVTTVLDITENDMPIAILDTSAACHMPDVLEMPYRPPLYMSGENGEKKYSYRLGSQTCLAGDVIGEYSFDEPLSVGDKLIFMDMAIYSMVKNNTFNGMPLPDIAILRENGEYEIIKRFSYNDFKERLS